MYRLGLLKVGVSDLDKSIDFYLDHLGFKLDFKVVKYGWAQLSSGEIELALYVPGLGGGDKTFGESTDFHLILKEDDFDPLAEALLRNGYLSENMIHKGNDGSTFIDVLDPDKNIIKVMRMA